MLRIAITVGVIYALFAVFVFFRQRQMLYFPEQGGLADFVARAKSGGLEPWYAPGDRFIGWKHCADSNGPQALVVHGNGGCAADRGNYVDGLQAAGIRNVYVLEYPGYGPRPGSPSQQSLCEAASEAFDLLAKEKPVYVVGESLGTGVATFLAGTHPKQVPGTALLAPYHSMTSVAQSHMFLLPVGLMLKDRYPASQWLAAYRGPVAVVLGDADTVIPLRFGQRLFDEYGGSKKLWIVSGGSHGDACARPESWWRELGQFWKTNRPAPNR